MFFRVEKCFAVEDLFLYETSQRIHLVFWDVDGCGPAAVVATVLVLLRVEGVH